MNKVLFKYLEDGFHDIRSVDDESFQPLFCAWLPHMYILLVNA
jgi:hypothetical protein